MHREERAGHAQLLCITQERGAAVRGHLAASCSQPTVPESCPSGARRHQLTQRCIVRTWLWPSSSLSDRCGMQTQVIQDGRSLKLYSPCPVVQPITDAIGPVLLCWALSLLTLSFSFLLLQWNLRSSTKGKCPLTCLEKPSLTCFPSVLT